jgi:hypothetical protein
MSGVGIVARVTGAEAMYASKVREIVPDMGRKKGRERTCWKSQLFVEGGD